MQLIPHNPIKGFKVGVRGKRITFFTPEMEQELLRHAFRAQRTALWVCIRTGARYHRAAGRQNRRDGENCTVFQAAGKELT